MSLADALPPSLNLPPHLSAHKYLFVCTLTVAAWDTLVLSPRTWRLFKTPERSALKTLFYFLRAFMPVEFTIVAVAFFDTNWSQATCGHFYLFEPICTAILLAATSAVHVIRINAIYEKNKAVLFGLGSLFAIQVVVTAVASAFYESVPLLEGQGCIAGPKHIWVGMYWVATTVLYSATFILALIRSIDSLKLKPLTPWKLMLRDGLNLYGAIWIVHMVNMLFWFIIKPTGPADTIRTIVTSMAAVITTSMTLRIILSVRGTLVSGGTFAGSSTPGSSHTTHVISTGRSVSTGRPPMYTLDQMRAGNKEILVDSDKSSFHIGPNDDILNIDSNGIVDDRKGVKVTIDREVGYDVAPFRK